MTQVDTVSEPPSAVTSTRLRAEEALDRPAELGPYVLLGVLGRGGMATVYRARDGRLGREVALKLLLPHLRRDRSALMRFGQEARAVAKLRHEGIVSIFDVAAEDASEPYLVVELVRGTSLREVLREAPPMPPEIAGELVLEILLALDHAHAAGIVHRDIKPENVLIDRDTRSLGRARAKLADFGIAKIVGQQTVTNTGELVGSPAYMAPEQLEGAPCDARTDLFALGVLFYECVTGRRPFEGDGAAQVIRRIVSGSFAPVDAVEPRVGSRWAQVVGRALAHAPEERYPSARAMIDAVRAELERFKLPETLRFALWIDAPAAVGDACASALEPLLLASARGAQRADDPLAIAADVNRLLALAPAHPEALALLIRRTRRARAKRVVASAVAIALIALIAVAFAAFVRGETERTVHPPALVSAPVIDVPKVVDVDAVGARDARDADVAVSRAEDATASTRATRSIVEGSRSTASAAVLERARSNLPGLRRVEIETLQPPFGVFVRVDDGETTPVSEGASLEIASGRRVLHFACKGDACIPQEIVVAAVDVRPRINVALRIRPARLRILAAPERRFQLLELPAVELHLGDDNEVPMRGSRTTIHVVDVASGRKTAAVLTAGVVTTVSPE